MIKKFFKNIKRKINSTNDGVVELLWDAIEGNYDNESKKISRKDIVLSLNAKIFILILPYCVFYIGNRYGILPLFGNKVYVVFTTIFIVGYSLQFICNTWAGVFIGYLIGSPLIPLMLWGVNILTYGYEYNHLWLLIFLFLYFGIVVFGFAKQKEFLNFYLYLSNKGIMFDIMIYSTLVFMRGFPYRPWTSNHISEIEKIYAGNGSIFWITILGILIFLVSYIGHIHYFYQLFIRYPEAKYGVWAMTLFPKEKAVRLRKLNIDKLEDQKNQARIRKNKRRRERRAEKKEQRLKEENG